MSNLLEPLEPLEKNCSKGLVFNTKRCYSEGYSEGFWKTGFLKDLLKISMEIRDYNRF